MITQQTIDNIIASMDIVEVVGEHLDLKKKGANYVANCPFHEEKSGSFTVSQSRQMFKCFGCGKGGDAITFLMDHTHINYPEALKDLARRYNITIEETAEQNPKTPEEKTEIENAYKLMYEVKRLYHQALLDNPAAMQYLIDRGFTTETIALEELGFAPDAWRTVSDFVNREPRRWDLAVKCCVCEEKGDKNYDFFRNRIMIPIHDEKGNCVSFGGRIWTDKQEAVKTEAKYMNGKDSFIYKKQDVLFGMDKSKYSIAKGEEALLTEGYLDVIKARQNGINIAVASCGTAVTEHQVKRLLKIANRFMLAGDNDKAKDEQKKEKLKADLQAKLIDEKTYQEKLISIDAKDNAGEKSMLKAVDLFYTHGAQVVYVAEWPAGIKDMDEWMEDLLKSDSATPPVEIKEMAPILSKKRKSKLKKITHD